MYMGKNLVNLLSSAMYMFMLDARPLPELILTTTIKKKWYKLNWNDKIYINEYISNFDCKMLKPLLRHQIPILGLL